MQRREGHPESHIQRRDTLMPAMVGTLTRRIASYYGKWWRPLEQNRAGLRDAQIIGEDIILLAEQKWVWRHALNREVLPELARRDPAMYERVIGILDDATENLRKRTSSSPPDNRPTVEIPIVQVRKKEEPESPVAQHVSRLKVAQDRLRIFLQMGDTKRVRLFTGQSYRVGQQMLDLIKSDPSQYADLYHEMRRLKGEDPDMHQRIVTTLHEIQASRIERVNPSVPQQRRSVRQWEVYSYPEHVAQEKAGKR